MKLILSRILIISLFLFPLNYSFAGKGDIDSTVVNSDRADSILSSYYDLRDRSSYVQITNVTEQNLRIHVQIFQHDRDCSELDFFDELTPNDTVIYDLDNVVKNNGNDVPINLQENSYGYVLITPNISLTAESLVGNMRIVDNSGYEYRTNLAGYLFASFNTPDDIFNDLIANYNTIDGANLTDIVGYSFFFQNSSTNLFDSGFLNNDQGFDFSIFIFDLNEEPLSCDRRNFACGNVMNYGLNEDYPQSKNTTDLLCPGGGLTDPGAGYILFQDPDSVLSVLPGPDEVDILGFVGAIGLNNGNGTGSFDYWISVEEEVQN